MTSSGEEMPQEDATDEGVTPLLRAARDGDVAGFKRLLECGEDVLQRDEDGRTALHWAAQSGCVPIIMAGVTRGLMWHVNSKSKHGLTPLHVACLAGYARTVHVLLAMGADMMLQTEEGYSPLLCAAGNGHNDVARILVGAGCDANEILPKIGVDALHIAAWTDQPDVLEDLLLLGGDMNKKSKTGKTALDFAIEQNHTDCENVLRKHENKLHLELKQKLQQQEDFFRTKLNYLADKIHKYYDNRLKEEIAYFEEQLQDQHDKDNVIISKLKGRIDELLKTELDDDDDDDEEDEEGDHNDRPAQESEQRSGGDHDGGGRGGNDANGADGTKGTLRPTPRGLGDNLKPVSLRRRRRSSQFAHRPARFSITAPHGPAEHQESSDDEHALVPRRRYDRQVSVEMHRQTRRPGSGKGKSMMELVDDVSKRNTSVNFVKGRKNVMKIGERNLNSPKPSIGVPSIRLLQPSKPTHPRSTTPTQSMSITPSNSSFSPSPPPPSPVDPSNLTVTSRSSSPSLDSVFTDDTNGNHTGLSPSPQRKSRRSSIAEFLRPHFRSKSQNDAEEKSRRKSVGTRVLELAGTPSPQPPKSKPRKKGFSLFSGSLALPGIPHGGMIEEEQYSPADVDVNISHPNSVPQ